MGIDLHRQIMNKNEVKATISETPLIGSKINYQYQDFSTLNQMSSEFRLEYCYEVTNQIGFVLSGS